MTPFLRLSSIVVVTSLFAALAQIVPELVSPATLKWLTSVFGFVLTLELLVFRQLNSTTGVGVLDSSEMERFNYRRADLRSRLLWVAGVAMASMFALYTVSVFSDRLPRNLVTVVTGFLVGIAVNYILIIVRWISQLAAFSDRLRLLEQQQRELVDQLKRLADAKKKS